MSPNDHALFKAYSKLEDLAYDLLCEEDGANTDTHEKMRKHLDEIDVLRRKYEAEHHNDMWVVAFINEGMEQGTELLRRLCAPDEDLDPEAIAKQIAEEYETELDESDGYIPNCSGDIRVEFRRDPDNGTIIWSGQSFYFKRGG